ncbi:MAG TPA: hypothetical protein VMH00_12720 [Candidatus Limnocylindrales bacterium]|nr:hypothetical protein [Candidatus Limnocylindrales bacterium]
MSRGFVNQKLGKRNSRRAELQRAKNEPGKACWPQRARETRERPERRTPSRKSS